MSAVKDNKGFSKIQFEEIIVFIFSWIVVLPICVVLTGKFLSQVFDYKVKNDDLFAINVYFLRIKAEKSEVMIGFGVYLLVFFTNLLFAKEYPLSVLNDGAGLKLTKWNAVCLFSALCSSSIATLVFIVINLVPRLFRRRNIISKDKEAEILSKIASVKSDNDGGKVK